MNQYSASEVFQFAIQIEENGEHFYRELSKHVSDPDTKKFLELLANEEVKHGSTFKKLLSTFEKYDPQENYPDEYFAYLKALVNNMIFEKAPLKEQIDKLKTPKEAIRFAIQNEWESILYYQEIKKLVPKDQQHLVEEIIEEERTHFLKLSQFLDVSNDD